MRMYIISILACLFSAKGAQEQRHLDFGVDFAKTMA